MDSFCIKAGIHRIGPPIAVVGLGSLDVRSCHSSHFAGVGRNTSSGSLENQPGPSWGVSFRRPLRYLWLNGVKNRHGPTLAVEGSVSVEEDKAEEKEVINDNENAGRNGNWVLKILHVRSLWKEEVTQDKRAEDLKEMNGDSNDEVGDGMEDGKEEECEACSVCDDGENIVFDRDSFSKLLRKVPLPEARLYSKLSYLSNLAYSIPNIKPANLLRSHGLRFVTSSVKKKEKAEMDDLGKASSEGVENDKIDVPENCEDMGKGSALDEDNRETLAVEEEQIQVLGHRISAAAAYQIAASAASYLHTHTKSILPLVFSKSQQSEESSDGKHVERGLPDITNKEKTSLMATTDSVTAVVAAKEEVKQAVADDLNSVHSSPCQWFACDDEQSGTRFFVIQGSESLASWQANLLFEPVPFEGSDVLVHRGIYEVAKGIYQQMLPEVHAHLKSVGDRATFRFTGHSLGGSLSLLINLMLLIRGEVPSSSLLPVITFGAPTVMCGGNQLLQMLGLPKSHLKSITLHRDIVPRAFSCHYPNHVAEFLKVVNGSFRTLPCLNNQKLLYAPMGDYIILQPDDNFSPSHDLLPSGSGLYLLSSFDDGQEKEEANKQIDAALSVFLNSPHPLEILSDRGAFGAGGHILRDHDMNSYFKSVRNVIRKELIWLRKARRQARRRVWWPLNLIMASDGGSYMVSVNVIPEQINVYGMLQSGKESLKWFGQVIISKNIHLLVVLLVPVKLLILGTSRILR